MAASPSSIAATGAAREWNDPVEWLGLHFTAPHTAGVAYMAGRKSLNGEVRSLMYWGGVGEPRELMRIDRQGPLHPRRVAPRRSHAARGRAGRIVLTGFPTSPTPRRCCACRVGGGEPVSTGLTMDGLRDITIHPDGRRIAFNAGWKRGEQWVMEHLLPQ